MKTLKLLMFLCVSVVMMSCSNDDSDSGSNTSADIKGKWKMVAMQYDGKTTTTVSGMSVSADYVGVGSDFTYMLELTDPDQLKTSGGYKVTLTTTTNGQSSTQVQQVPNTTLNGKWVRNGNEFTTTVNGEEAPSVIEELTANKLRLKATSTRDLSQGGYNITTTVTTYSVFERVAE